MLMRAEQPKRQTEQRPGQSPLDIVLFEHDLERAHAYADAGITHFIVDTESKNKQARQKGFDTEIAPVSIRSVGPLVRMPGVYVSCRINGFGDTTREEVEAAVSEGVHRIFLPMISSVEEVQAFIDAVGGRCETAILIETQHATTIAAELAQLPVGAIYVGLNDLAISRGSQFIFSAVRDGPFEECARRSQGGSSGSPELQRLVAAFPSLAECYWRKWPRRIAHSVSRAVPSARIWLAVM
jgi:hypothetical protein